MSQESSAETERVVVQTYVPQYQRDHWDEHADALGMNRSEFIRTMVQAGRQVYATDQLPNQQVDDVNKDNSESNLNGPAQDGDSLTDSVQELLAENGCLDWDELLTEVSGDIETRLENALEQLQAANQVKYSGREGGYVLQGETA